MQIPRNGRPSATAARADGSRPLAAKASAQRPNAPTPGSTTPAAPATSSGSSTSRAVGAHVLERLLGRAQVADAVVQDGDEPAHRAAPVTGRPWSQGALGRGDAHALDAHGVAQGTGPRP